MRAGITNVPFDTSSRGPCVCCPGGVACLVSISAAFHMASSSSDSAGAASGAGGSGAGAASVPPSAHPHLVHRIASCEEWDAALRCGFFKGAAIDVKDNFIHFSTSVQVKLTAQRYFAGREDLMLLTIRA